MLKKTNEFTVEEALTAFMLESKLLPEYHFYQVRTNWNAFVGEALAGQTEKLWLDNGTLHVQLKAPVWKNEIAYAKNKIKQKINDAIGYPLIKAISIH